MSRRTTRFMAAAGLASALAAPVRADDVWELGAGDDSVTSGNVLRHGLAQSHDLQGPPSNPDRDWMTFVAKQRHSYEARVSNLTWDSGCAGAPCPLFDRMTAAGAVLTPGTTSSDDIENGGESIGLTVRWIAASGGREYLRALGDQFLTLDAQPYDVVLHDTTLFVPRWNNTATQSTVLVLQNTTNEAVQGFAYFHDGGGALLAAVAVDVPQHGVQVVATASVPALQGRSGSAQIAHTGGYEALAGKAVALEPATGFTFDTPITAVPR